MGWTHDYRDVSRNRRADEPATPTSSLRERERAVDNNRLTAPLGIPRILGRRARWVGARLRHVRSD
ncbi:hypothetical protein ACFW9F_05680 [Streptomyces sp. NPDC059506]|uniref:hypothetical protein n=1 Tax=Streptomyces TaxID=1883 RepID=UPI000CB9A519|nr:hypothetical protein [Streptomyces sp. HB2AG]MCZ2524565.1 hypothetical protein [Streptomyces sp. HB2AG]PLW72042.1 hypothetical protein C0036_14710 [Streptomyces sp. DJ]